MTTPDQLKAYSIRFKTYGQLLQDIYQDGARDALPFKALKSVRAAIDELRNAQNLCLIESARKRHVPKLRIIK